MATFSWYGNPNLNGKIKSEGSICKLENIKLRFLCPADIREVWTLCSECFPIEYPQTWYEDITSNPKFFSLAALDDDRIVGLIVAEIKEYSRLCNEDKDIIYPCLGGSTKVVYILSLAVNHNYRRNGIASLLLDNLIKYFSNKEHSACKALFLHVLTTNHAAIRFYEGKCFKYHTFLPYYYFIKGQNKDGFVYVMYINGGHPRNGLLENLKCRIQVACESEPVLWAWQKILCMLQWIFPIAKPISIENNLTSVMKES